MCNYVQYQLDTLRPDRNELPEGAGNAAKRPTSRLRKTHPTFIVVTRGARPPLQFSPCHPLILSLLVVLLCASTPVATNAAPALEGDFGPGADLIDFDGLALGQEVDFQYRLQGVVIPPDTRGAAKVVDSAGLGGAAGHSAPYALRVPANQQELQIEFLSPRERAGMAIGAFSEALDATLEAYDAAGSLLDSVSISFTAPGAPDVDQFIGVDVGGIAIRRLILRYTTPAQIVVDSLLPLVRSVG